MNLIFLSVFFYVSYSSVNSNLYNYRNQLEKVFTGYDDVILNIINIILKVIKILNEFFFTKVNNVESFWTWVSNDFLSYLSHDDSLFDSSLRETYSNFDYYISDASSILVGYPIIRQLRINNGYYKF
jgi:hypothetical protein